jgi:hypothetical protein
MRVTDADVRSQRPLARVPLWVASHVELLALGWPLALWGIVNNAPAFTAVRLAIYRLFRPRRDRRSTVKIYQGTLIFLGVTLVQTGLVTWLLTRVGLSAWWGLAYFLSLPLSGWYAVSFLERRREALRTAKAWVLLSVNRRLRPLLRQRRARLIESLRSAIEAVRSA